MFFHLPIGSVGQTCAKIPSWMVNGNRIVNGHFAPSPIPWQVKVIASFNSLGESYSCGGTILDEETILSAAHCFYHHESGKIFQHLNIHTTAQQGHFQQQRIYTESTV